MDNNTMNTHTDAMSLSSMILAAFIASTVAFLITLFIRHKQYEKDLIKITNGMPVKSFSSFLPIVGDLEFMFNPKRYQDTHHPKYGKIFGTYILGEYYVLMQGPELFEQVFFDNVKNIKFEWTESINRLFGTRGILSATGDEHKRQRRMVLNYVGIPSMNRLFPGFVQIFNKCVNNWVERTKDGSYIDLIPEISKAVWEAISFVVLGDDLPQDTIDELREVMNTFGKGVISLPIDLPFTALGKSMVAGKRFRELLMQEHKRRQAMPDQGFNRKDFLQTLINETCNEGFPEGFNIDLSISVIWASLDTTKMSTFYGINTLIEHPKEWARVREDIKKAFGDEGILGPDVTYTRTCEEAPYVAACVKEVMRWNGHASLNMRRVVNDIEVTTLEGKKYTIPANARLLSSLYYYQRDESSPVFHDATAFNPERFMGSNPEDKNPTYKATAVSFGIGDRLCPGNPIAKLEMEVFITLMSKYKWIRYERPQSWKGSVFMIPHDGYYIKAVPLTQ